LKKSFVLVGILMLSVLLAGCQTGKSDSAMESPEPLPTETVAMTNTPEPTNTALPSETPAPTNTEVPPTATFTSTVTASPVPSPTLNLELRIYVYNYCEVPVNIAITGPLSFNLKLEPKVKTVLYAPLGVYNFWNDKNGERIEVNITGLTHPYCICTKYCHVEN